MGHYRDEALVAKVIARIRKLREQKGITLQEFYNDTNIHLARIESNKCDISIDEIDHFVGSFHLRNLHKREVRSIAAKVHKILEKHSWLTEVKVYEIQDDHYT